MLCRIELPNEHRPALRPAMEEIGKQKDLSIRVWSPDARKGKPRLAISATYRQETPLALLRSIRDGRVPAEAVAMIGNCPACRSLADQFEVPWHNIGDDEGNPNDDQMLAICDQYDVDYIILARYMRVLSPAAC